MLIDSHCHLNTIDLADFDQDFDQLLAQAKSAGVQHMLSVCVEPEDYPQLQAMARKYPNISISAGIHPNIVLKDPISAEMLCEWAADPACIAIGETGLDYYRTSEEETRELQKDRFRQHIRAAIKTSKPLIIHTREAAEDTLRLMKEENAEQIGGVMHCFAENLEVANKSIDLNFYISLSGILTFKNALNLQEVARAIPLERILIETDSPYLAPVPFRGKQNHPALVKHVAEKLAELRGESYESIATITTENFYRCFRLNP